MFSGRYWVSRRSGIFVIPGWSWFGYTSSWPLACLCCCCRIRFMMQCRSAGRRSSMSGSGSGSSGKFTQDGDWVNRMIRRRFPKYKVFDSYPSIRRHLRKAYTIEKIHFAFFLFFLYTSLYALVNNYFFWAGLIMLTNLIFNIYPNLLQQYNRLRLRQLMRRSR